ncbi:MAG TPA: DinB family protein [Acidimicrobiales bacterium]|nr:DinB family protein [Acidimicrobiales bacterium]
MTIIPDDKDWTWVLERPCLECGFDARDIGMQDIPSLLGKLAGSWQEVLLRADVARRPSPDKWSPLEYSCHVRDVFRLFDKRLQSMMLEDGAHFENWDQDRTAVEDRYDLRVPSVVSRELSDASEVLAHRFARVDGSQWEHRGRRSNGSEFTVATLATYLAHDPIHHLWDVEVT